MTKDHSIFGRFFFGNPSKAEREDKVLRYVIHRINEDADLQDVLREPYVQRNCSQAEIAEIINNPELVHAAREHMEQVFKSEEMTPRHRHPTSEGR
jgi:hypothetical protein